MGILMGKIEMDDRGRLTIPAGLREKLNLKPGDKLSIEIDDGNDKVLKIQKTPTKEEIFQNLVGCIKIPQKNQPSIKEIKGIWKTSP